jgi:hypothetical protein
MSLFRGLSGRLLVVTVMVVMLVEVVIFVPSVARFRAAYLEERIERAHLATLAVLAAPNEMVTADMERELLAGADVLNVVSHRDGRHALMLSAAAVPPLAGTHDLREAGSLDLIRDALARMATPSEGDVIRVIGVPRRGSEALEIVVEAGPLRREMIAYGWRILQLSLVISLITAAVVFAVIRLLVVRPLLRLTDNLRAFRERPDDPERVLRPGRETGEFGEAARALAEMQETVRRALRERQRLASLGEAVAKISHDLRNMLASLQLLVDRLEASEDPAVTRVAPKLIASLDRAISLSQRTLDYGKAEEAAPEPRQVRLAQLAAEVAEGLGLGPETAPVRCRHEIDESHIVLADNEQLYRVLANLARNAAEAIATTGRPGEVRIAAAREDGWDVIRVCDTGPGLPARAMENIFRPFQGGARRGGSGLGLAIAAELVTAHGGRLSLASSTPEGTVFEIRLPARAPRIPDDAKEDD